MEPRPLVRNANQEECFQKYKMELRNYLTVSQLGIEIYRFEKGLNEQLGKRIPYSSMGMQSLLDFLFECRDIIDIGILPGEDRMSRYTKKYVFLRMNAVDEANMDLHELVSGQEKGKSRKRGTVTEISRNRAYIVPAQYLYPNGAVYSSQNVPQSYNPVAKNGYEFLRSSNSTTTYQTRRFPQFNKNYPKPLFEATNSYHSKPYSSSGYRESKPVASYAPKKWSYAMSPNLTQSKLPYMPPGLEDENEDELDDDYEYSSGPSNTRCVTASDVVDACNTRPSQSNIQNLFKTTINGPRVSNLITATVDASFTSKPITPTAVSPTKLTPTTKLVPTITPKLDTVTGSMSETRKNIEDYKLRNSRRNEEALSQVKILPKDIAVRPLRIPRKGQLWQIVLIECDQTPEYDFIFRMRSEDVDFKLLESQLTDYYDSEIGKEKVVNYKEVPVGFYAAKCVDSEKWCRVELKNDGKSGRNPTNPLVYMFDYGRSMAVDLKMNRLMHLEERFTRLPRSAYYGKVVNKDSTSLPYLKTQKDAQLPINVTSEGFTMHPVTAKPILYMVV